MSPPSTPLSPTLLDVLVVIVNFRSAELTLRALASLARERLQTGLALKVIVVENASGDADHLTRVIAERFADFVELWVSPVNGGFGAGNNLGLSRATALGLCPRYVHFLNPDTEVRTGAVRALVRFLDGHPKAALAGGSFEFEDGTPWRMAFRFPTALSEFVVASRLGVLSKLFPEGIVALELGDVAAEVDWPSGASMMIRREVLETVGGFDEGFFLYFEEVDLCRRVKAAGWECWYVPQSRVMHLCGQSTGVTELTTQPRRLPSYWFASRRRYFAKHHGFRYAALADVAFLAGNVIGNLKDTLKRRPRVPHLLRDLVRESVLRPRHFGTLAPAHSFIWPRALFGPHVEPCVVTEAI